MSNREAASSFTSPNHLYDTKTLLCKNQCGFYGNSMQYEGYCSICYRKLKTKKSNQSYPTFMTSSTSFDDSISLLKPSQSFSIDEKKSSNQFWNEHSNLSKFSAKVDKRKNSALNKIFRRPSSSTTVHLGPQNQHSSLNLVDTMTKVADKAVNLVDQSLQSSISSLNSSTSFQFLSPMSLNSENFIDFINIMNKLLKPSPPCSEISPSTILVSGILSKTNGNKFAAQNNENILMEFEEKFRQNFAQLYSDIVKQMNNFLDKFKEIIGKDSDSDMLSLNTKHSEMVQDFYRKINRYLIASGSIKLYLDKLYLITKPISLTNDSIGDNSAIEMQTSLNNDDSEKFSEAVMIMIESYINNRIYDLVLPSLMSEFEEQDIQLQKKIRRFYWIKSQMIGTCIDEDSVFYRDQYEEAINNIVQVDSKRTSYEKMLCITNCSKNLFEAINIASNIKNSVNEASDLDQKKSKSKNLASADDFLPALIYLVLKANPTMLYSNINFVTRFAFEKRVLQGEHAYHFCSLNAVIAHIENLDHVHLNMSQEQFEFYSNGQNDTDKIGNIHKVIETNLKVLSELKDKQSLIKHETFKLKSDIHLFRQLIKTKLESCARSGTDTKLGSSFENKCALDDNQDVANFNSTSTDILKPVPINNN